jgi:indolepyruvate ferredoxin oxidoreductase beta subunit
MNAPPKAITVAILAMGGEGGGVLADWIVDLAEYAGYCVQTTSVPGVAQRTGSTIYYVEIFPDVDGKQPVLALMPVPGELDIVLGSELMEAARAVQRGLVTPDRTTLIASTHRVYSMTEKTAMADGRVDPVQFVDACKAAAKVFVRADFARIAEEAGSVISAPLFGALAATGSLPFERKHFEDAIQRGGVGVESSLAAFAAGFKAATEPAPVAPAESPTSTTGPRLKTLAERIEKSFPTASHAILLAGIQRLADYQDVSYATEYLDCLESVRDVDQGDFAVLNETGRYLALWMSYEDAIRVADLKIRRTRFERVHREAHVDSSQVLQINEFLHPRVQEIADILPAALGRWILKPGWVRSLIERLTRQGKVLQTTSLSGFLQLYFLASLRPLRRGSLRFQREHKRIAEWLTQVLSVAREDRALALEVAECPRLVKGYGDTHLLGSRNFDAVMAALPKLRGTKEAARQLRKLREAALADDTGKKLIEAMHECPELEVRSII